MLTVIYKRAIELYNQHYDEKGLITIVKCLIKSFHSSIRLNVVYYLPDKEKQFENLLKKMSVNYDDQSRFYYWIDEKLFFNNRYGVMGNMPMDYSFVIDNSISDIKEIVKRLGADNLQMLDMLSAIDEYIDRITSELVKHEGRYVDRIVKDFKSMKESEAQNLEDALQRILFWNSLFHQIGQKLVGLGRLDYILDRFEVSDQKEAKNIIRDFCISLHKYYDYKSQALKGDTGQIIVIGGLEEKGEYFFNNYTKIFIDVIKELRLPDPKLMLRVSQKTPKDLIDASLECVITGNGSPLYSNDDVVIPLLKEYGFDEEDVYNYAVSACWEPVIVGKTSDQNNLSTIPFADVFINTINSVNNSDISSMNDLLECYRTKLKDEIDKHINSVEKKKWECTPLVSLFFEDCRKKGKDIANGGAKYNNYGLLTDGLSNTVNSLLNIEKLVFNEQYMTLLEVDRFINSEVRENGNLKEKLKSEEEYFGQDSDKIIELTNKIFDMAKEAVSCKKNHFGGGYKVGLSSPNYLIDGTKTGMTFDGRSSTEPLGTHISCDKNLAYTELLSFASKIDYSKGGFNGNVVDLMVTPDFITRYKDKFLSLLVSAFALGVFQLQMNVVSSATLIAAKQTPEEYRNLIVRVWGFSAYYVDLPETYQDMLINRSLKNEGKVA